MRNIVYLDIAVHHGNQMSHLAIRLTYLQSNAYRVDGAELSAQKLNSIPLTAYKLHDVQLMYERIGTIETVCIQF